MHNSKPIVIAFLGKPGAGKGTQAKLLTEKLGLEYIGSGELLRKRKQEGDYTGRKIAACIDEGNLVPSPIVFSLWMDKLEAIKDSNKEISGILFDGSPRKVLEARLLKEAINWYEWNDNFKVIYLDIPNEEAVKRLLKRSQIEGREDDDEEGIKTRLEWFEEEVRKVIEFYEKGNGHNLIRINGDQSVEEVYNEIISSLKL